MTRLPSAAERVLRTSTKLTDRQLMQLGRAWLRVFGPTGRRNMDTKYIAAAWKDLDGALDGAMYVRIGARAERISERVFPKATRSGYPTGWSAARKPEQCVRIAIEGAAICAALAPYYGPEDALSHDLARFSAAYRRVAGDEPLLSLINAPAIERS